MTSSSDLRKLFLDFFQQRGHTIVPSSSLVPGSDPTLLFTNAGMVQFKDVFLGLEKRPYVRAVSSQRCVRAGGKHNDLENVGYTARHHTFFEMLGNFSFGDYFKHDAIQYAWAFLTDVLKLPPEKLWITVYEQDDETADIWLNEMHVDPARFSRIGAKDNFWSMGDTGPCGPCSEIFYDHGPDIAGGPPGSPDADGDRYIEIWNLVFMQFDRAADGSMKPLPKPSVDTGMGLERLAAVLQHVHNNYEIDLFRNLVKVIAQLADVKDFSNASLRVIADHIRACAFLIVDGVLPSNEGRGYVLRRIIRRAARHGYELNLREPFFYKMVAPLVKEMGAAYPELAQAQAQVERALQQEEERFGETLAHGMKILDEDIAKLKGKTISGATLFKLYDTYGFPVDLTADIAFARGLKVDLEGYERAMNEQRERARSASQFGVAYSQAVTVEGHTLFTGYDHLVDRSVVLALFKDGQTVTTLRKGEAGMVVLERTPFYAESGGQVGDRGVLADEAVEFEVNDTQKQGADAIGHLGAVRFGELRVGQAVEARVDVQLRRDTAYHHSATHLMHAALRQVLGTHVAQKGSQVSPERLRFDFSHFEPIKPGQLAEIERLVNEQIRINNAVETKLMPVKDAMASGAMALFGEKYGDEVRVLRMGQFSTELCGGTHVGRTGDIGVFKIVSEGGVAAGVRRIEAVSGARAENFIAQLQDELNQTAFELGFQSATGERLASKVATLKERLKSLEKENNQLKAKMASSQGSDLAGQAVEINGLKVLAARLDGVDAKVLRDTVDQLKNKLGSAAVVLAAVSDGKVSLVAGVTADFNAKVKAGELVNMVAQQIGGKGGGRADMAQAGGTDPAKLEGALRSVPEWVRQQLE